MAVCSHHGSDHRFAHTYRRAIGRNSLITVSTTRTATGGSEESLTFTSAVPTGPMASLDTIASNVELSTKVVSNS